MNDKAPVDALIWNLAGVAAADDRIGRADESGSVAATVVTAVVFSGIEMVAVSPPPFDVITGGSLTGTTWTVACAVLLSVSPSETTTVISRSVASGFSPELAKRIWPSAV